MSFMVKARTIEEEYVKNPDISAEEIEKLRVWVNSQPHLPSQYITDIQLLVAFHCCNMRHELTQKVIELHYTNKTNFTSIFGDRCLDQKIKKSLNIVLITRLAEPSVHGYSIIYCRLLTPDTTEFVFCDMTRLFMMIFDLCQYEDGTWPGCTILVDMTNTCLGHLAKLDLTTIRQVLYFLQECMFVRLKEIHFINAPSFMDKLMMLLKPFMKKALLDIIQIHQRDSSTLDQFISRSSLPIEDGGLYKSLNILKEEQRRRIEDNLQFFLDESRCRVVHTARPGGTTMVEKLFGMLGSFKKLNMN